MVSASRFGGRYDYESRFLFRIQLFGNRCNADYLNRTSRDFRVYSCCNVFSANLSVTPPTMKHHTTATGLLAAALSVYLFTASSPQVASATVVSNEAKAPVTLDAKAYAGGPGGGVGAAAVAIALSVLANAVYEGAKAAAYWLAENADISSNEASWDGMTSLQGKRVYVPDVALDAPAL